MSFEGDGQGFELLYIHTVSGRVLTMQKTLPLFEDVSDQSLDQLPGSDMPSSSPAVTRRYPHRQKSGASGPDGSEQHLNAARRLSHRIRRYPDRSVEQTRAGLAICRHLQALLAQSEHETGQL